MPTNFPNVPQELLLNINEAFLTLPLNLSQNFHVLYSKYLQIYSELPPNSPQIFSQYPAIGHFLLGGVAYNSPEFLSH